MALKSGLAAQIGYGEESTWGTAVTTTRFLPLISESITQDIARIESEAIIAGRRLMTSTQWKPGPITVAGDVQHYLTDQSLGLILKHALGAVSTTGSGPYTHTITPGDLSGKGLTIQVGRPDTAGTVQPHTFAGCKITSWELAAAVGEYVTLGLSVVGKSEATTTPALASASYASGIKAFRYKEASLTIGGSAANVRKVTLNGDNGLKTDRRFLGSDTISEPLEAGLRKYAGSLEVEYEGLTQYTRFVNATEAALVLTITDGTYSVTVTENVRFDGASPVVAGRDVLTQTLPIVAVASGADSTGITVVVVNADATP